MTLPDVREVVKSLLEEQRTTEDVGIPATHANRYVYKAGDLAGAPGVFISSRSLSRINARGKTAVGVLFFSEKEKK